MDPRLVGRQPRPINRDVDNQQMQSAKFTLLSSLLKPERKATKLTPAVINQFHPLLVAVATDSTTDSPEVDQWFTLSSCLVTKYLTVCKMCGEDSSLHFHVSDSFISPR